MFVAVRRLKDRVKGSPYSPFSTEGYYFDLADQMLHKIQVKEVHDVHSAVVAGQMAWFVGVTDGQTVLVGVNDENRISLPLPKEFCAS